MAKTTKVRRDWLIPRITRAARKMRPTLKHRPAITFGILGTVYGINAAGEVKYFDYDWESAFQYAGIADADIVLKDGVDLRYAPAPNSYFLPGHDMWNPERCVRKGQKAYWILKEDK